MRVSLYSIVRNENSMTSGRKSSTRRMTFPPAVQYRANHSARIDVAFSDGEVWDARHRDSWPDGPIKDEESYIVDGLRSLYGMRQTE